MSDAPSLFLPGCSLYNSSCFDILPILPEASVDMILTDPPYGTTNLAFDKLKIDWKAWWEGVHRVTTPQAIIVCFAAQPFTTDLINSNRKNFRYDLIWQKTGPVGFLSANVRPLRSHEHILIFCRRYGRRRQGQQLVMQSVYNPQLTEGTPYLQRHKAKRSAHYSIQREIAPTQNPGTRHPTSVLTYARDYPSTHPTAKPLALNRWLVRSFSHPGQTVLDTFCGGGSIVEAALREGRRIVAMEIDPVHFSTTCTRARVISQSPPL